MKGTNRRQMRKFLNKYIALIKVAFDNGLNADICTRLKPDNGRPWFTGMFYKEGADFTNPSEDCITNIRFVCYEWRTIEENEEVFEKMKKFVESYKK